MNRLFIFKKTIVLLFLLVNTILIKEAHAQRPAALSGNVLYGNSSGPYGNFQINAGDGTVQNPYVHMFTNDNTSTQYAGSLNFIAGYNGNGGAIAQSFQTRDSNGNWVRDFTIFQNHNVLIGFQSPTTQPNYRLAVDGQLVAKSVFVTAPATWADFVFAPAYRPMPLEELEQYLLAHRHLPNVPSAQEVETKGYDLAEMNTKLLQAVEELTLHVIELRKEVEKLKTHEN